MNWLLFFLLGIGMIVLFLFLNRFIPYLTADESKSSGRKGDERQRHIRRQAVIGSWGFTIYYVVLKIVLGLPVIQSLNQLGPGLIEPIINQELSQALLLNQGSDILLIAIIGYIVFHMLAHKKMTA